MAYVDKSMGAIVAVVRHYHTDEDMQEKKHLTTCSYHLHFLVIKDDEKKDIVLKCLDNSESISTYMIDYPVDIDNPQSVKKAVNEMLKMLIESWHNKEIDYYEKKTSLEQIFAHREDKMYWNKFNEIKEKAYAESRTSYLNYISESRNKQVSEQISTNKDNNQAEILMRKQDNQFISEAYKNEEHLLFSS